MRVVLLRDIKGRKGRVLYAKGTEHEAVRPVDAKLNPVNAWALVSLFGVMTVLNPGDYREVSTGKERSQA